MLRLAGSNTALFLPRAKTQVRGALVLGKALSTPGCQRHQASHWRPSTCWRAPYGDVDVCPVFSLSSSVAMHRYHWFRHEFSFPSLRMALMEGYALVHFAGGRNTLCATKQADIIPVYGYLHSCQLHTKNSHNRRIRICSCEVGVRVTPRVHKFSVACQC